MARFMVKASEYKNVCKAVNDRKLAELKKEIIEILKKQDEKEVKKAVDYFDSQELHYTHLEKSITGKWIKKAGYGVGTVRIWKGKKYKKIAPGKWARVFDKEGHGTNVAIGRLIAQVNKIDNAEDLEKFVAANKQRFVDENGKDLPVVEKLKAAVGSRGGSVGSKGTSENKDLDRYKTDAKNMATEQLEYYVEDLENGTGNIGTEYLEERKKIYGDELKNRKKSKELPTDKDIHEQLKEYGFKAGDKVSFNGDKWEVVGANLDYEGNFNGVYLTPDRAAGNLKSSNVTVFDIDKIKKESAKKEDKKTFKQEMNELYDAQDKAWEGFESVSEIKSTPENSKKFYDRVKKFVEENNIKLTEKHRAEIEDQNGHSFNEALELAGAYGEEKKEKALAKNREYSKKYKGQILDLSMIDEFKTENKPAKKQPVDFLSWMEKNDIVPEDYAAMRKDKIISDIKERTGLGDEDAVKITDDLIAYNKESENEKKTETKEVPFGGVDKTDEGEGKEALAMADKINEVAEKGELKVGDATFKVDKEGKEWAVRTEIMNAIKCKDGIDKINAEFEKKAKPMLEAELKQKLDRIKEKLPEIVKEGKLEENKKIVEERLKRYSEGAGEGLTVDAVISNHKKDVINKLENHVKDNELFTQKNTEEIELLGDVDHQAELCSIDTSAVFYAECKKLLEEAEKESRKEEKSAENGIDENTRKEALDRIKKYAGKKINSKPIEITKIEDDGKNSGFLNFEFKSGDDTYKMTYDYGFGGEKGGASIRKIETEENKTYWIQDSRGNRLTNEDAKKRIQSNLSKIIELESGDESRKDMKIRDLKLDNEYLKERLNPDDRKEFVSKVKKSLFDGFLGLELLEEDIDDIEEEKEEESLWNDYSAEEPDDFNSTEFQVREALNRRFNCL